MGDYLSEEELKKSGIKYCEGFQLHRLALIVNPKLLTVGRNVRIDAFTVLACGLAGVEIGDNSHLSSHVLIVAGSAGVKMGVNTNIAAGGKIYAESDDFSGLGLIGSTAPEGTRHVRSGQVVMENYSCIGMNSALMPGSLLAWGSVLIANSILIGQSSPCEILSGVPARKKADRKRDFIAHTQDDWAIKYLEAIDDLLGKAPQ